MDTKNRVAIPAKIRKDLGSPDYVYIMPDLHEKCLSLFAPADLEGRMEKLQQKSLTDKRASKARFALGQNLEKVVFDGQGRVRICERLLKFAMLEGKNKVVVVGNLHHVQLWSPDLLPEEEPVDQSALLAICEEAEF